MQAEDLIGFMLGDLRKRLEPVGRLEILEDVPDVDLVVVPVGGGGLIAGIATP